MIYLAFVAGGIGFGIALAAMGGGLGLGRAVAAAMEGTARQPEAAADIRTTLIIGSALIEALTIYALILGILMWTRLPSVEAILQVLRG
ncbi:MAG: ATP synthase F0 subunit C [Thermodesulfobacteriota bacterium]